MDECNALLGGGSAAAARGGSLCPENEGKHDNVDARRRGEAGGDADHRVPGDEGAMGGVLRLVHPLTERAGGREADAFLQGVVVELLLPRTKAAVSHFLGVLDVCFHEVDRIFLRLGQLPRHDSEHDAWGCAGAQEGCCVARTRRVLW